MREIGEALRIGGIGMGLVFGALVLFTFIVVIITRLFPSDNAEALQTTTPQFEPSGDDPNDRQRAAAIGVAVTLAMQSKPRSGASSGPQVTRDDWKLQGRVDLMRSRELER